MKLRAAALAATATLATPTIGEAPARVARWRCPRLFTVWMGERAGRTIYRGVRTVTRRNLRLLGRMEMCTHTAAAQTLVRSYDHHQAAAHAARVTVHRRYLYEQANGCTFNYGCWAIPPRIVFCESDYQNLAPNSASASGYYQITDPTWSGYGGGQYAPAAFEASRFDQSVVAERVWRADGSGPWTASEGCWG